MTEPQELRPSERLRWYKVKLTPEQKKEQARLYRQKYTRTSRRKNLNPTE
jgi:hypothetical protein